METAPLHIEVTDMLRDILEQYPTYEVILVVNKHIDKKLAATCCLSNANTYSQIIDRLEDTIEELKKQQKQHNKI